MTRRLYNVGAVERAASLLLAATLLAGAFRPGRGGRPPGFLQRSLLALSGLALLPRAATGYCGVKASMSGEASIGAGVREQWRAARSALRREPGEPIDSMETLYVAELQELHSAEQQLAALLHRVAPTLRHVALERHLRGYATELRSRAQDLARFVRASGAEAEGHTDQGMRALIGELLRMRAIYAHTVRDAALVASLQRLLHFKIAGYGSVAAFARSLGRDDEAAQLAGHADRDRAIDQELSALAKGILNPLAGRETLQSAPLTAH